MVSWQRSGLIFGAVWLAAGCHDGGARELVIAQRQALGTGESHPFQSRLVCERAPGSILVGVMYDISDGGRRRVARFDTAGNVGACELAIRAARNGRVCVPESFRGFTIEDLETGEREGSYRELSDCTHVTRGEPVLETRPGYVDLIAPNELAPFLAALPRLDDPRLDEALHDARTIWYDESSRVFVYQDSFGAPKGLRANRVGYDVGSNASEPDIRLLTHYFQPQKFKFPFAITAGSTFDDNVYALYFWLPPIDDESAVRPVRIWRNNSHWQWVFPVGTVIGEALFIQAPDDGAWFTFEVRTRTRSRDAWDTGVFRPYASAGDLAAAVRELRHDAETDPDVAALLVHLESPESLSAHTLDAPAYEAIFPPIEGAMDYLPAVEDASLIKALLSDRTFVDCMGSHWKSAGGLTTFAASTRARFHIVPAEYPAGMFELSETGCRTCHDQTSRPLNNLDDRVVLYGEIWGEDEIFTWHPFAVDTDAFGVSEDSRAVDPRLVEAGLVAMGAPDARSPIYRVLPKPYDAEYE